MAKCPLFKEDCLGDDCQWWFQIARADSKRIVGNCSVRMIVTYMGMKAGMRVNDLPSSVDEFYGDPKKKE